MKRFLFLLLVGMWMLPVGAGDVKSAWDTEDLSDLINLAIGKGDDAALKKCIGILEPPAKAGNPDAQAQLGGMLCALYANGFGTREDEEKGLSWAEKAARQGHAAACQILGASIRDNHRAAVEWMTKAADKELASAQWQLGSWYENGTHQLQKNAAKAAELYLKAAKQDEAGAQIALSRLYRKGMGVAKDPVEECKWLQAAVKHERYDYPRYMLGRNYEDGHGVKQDPEKAVYWYKEAAKYHSGNACVALAWCYTYGIGVEADFDRALQYLHRSETLPCNDYEKSRRDEIKDQLETYEDLNS